MSSDIALAAVCGFLVGAWAGAVAHAIAAASQDRQLDRPPRMRRRRAHVPDYVPEEWCEEGGVDEEGP